MKQKNITVNKVEVENSQITIEKVEFNEFDIKKELIKSVMDTERNPDIAFETIKFIIDAEIVHK
mgnify:CR=1 FL=1